jgi:phthiocerol/phenolphthiocerol synthesis type-I polyketide synthase E
MSELTSRLSELSASRRKLFEELLKANGDPPEPAPIVHCERSKDVATTPDPKHTCQQFFDSINQQLDQTLFGKYSLYLNFGYVPDNRVGYASVPVPEHTFNRNSMRLVLEVVGDCPLEKRRILDVGCGRGGTAAVIHQYFHAKQFIGMDLSSHAIRFCKSNHCYPGFAFHQGDAENLPFPDASMDVVINIESSSSYPNIRAFFCEVFRVLVDGGHFLYSDVLPVRRMSECTALLKAIGFQVVQDRDITSNVLLSCDEVARNRILAYRTTSQVAELSGFLGAPGSAVYEDMKNGSRTYRILQLQKAGNRDQSA